MRETVCTVAPYTTSLPHDIGDRRRQSTVTARYARQVTCTCKENYACVFSAIAIEHLTGRQTIRRTNNVHYQKLNFKALKTNVQFRLETTGLVPIGAMARTMFLSVSRRSSANESIFVGAVIMAVSKLFPMESPPGFFPATLCRALRPEVGYQAAQNIAVTATLYCSAESVHTPATDRLVRELCEQILLLTPTMPSTACCLQYAAFLLPSRLKAGRLVQGSCEQRGLATYKLCRPQHFSCSTPLACSSRN